MRQIIPSYYPAFHCIAGACNHSCCIGWEIDIDEDTLAFYEDISGEFGERLKNNILHSESGACFRLHAGDRCAFLNENGLCDIISTLGEGALCQICDDHPRFQNQLSDRLEVGLGLCCEEAGRLILGSTQKMTLLTVEDDEKREILSEWERKLLVMRERVFAVLQNRSKPFSCRVEEMLGVCQAHFPERSASEWADVFLSLERLDDAWDVLLHALRGTTSDIKLSQKWDLVFEQLLCYFVYRYFLGAKTETDVAVRAAFAALSYRMISTLCAQRDACSFEDIVELARMYSCEVEYSEENVERLFSLLEYPR